MRRQVLKKKIHPKLIKITIKLYDFERRRPFPTAESVRQLEQIFGIDRVPRREIHSKLDTIDLKITKELKNLLGSYDYLPQFR